MVVFSLNVSAELSKVTDLSPVDSPQAPFEYTFTIQCTQCKENHPKPVPINRYETHQITGSRGQANFVFKCKQCKSEHTAAIQRTDKTVLVEDAGKSISILTIDSRGMDFVEFHPIGQFQCKGTESSPPTAFNEVDLSEGEWYDYDDKAGEEVSITDVDWSIVRV